MGEGMMEEIVKPELLNIKFSSKGEIIKVRGWKSFRGMVRELGRINKQCKKLNWAGCFTVRLPLK
jgi:hypothetical protein